MTQWRFREELIREKKLGKRNNMGEKKGRIGENGKRERIALEVLEGHINCLNLPAST